MNLNIFCAIFSIILAAIYTKPLSNIGTERRASNSTSVNDDERRREHHYNSNVDAENNAQYSYDRFGKVELGENENLGNNSHAEEARMPFWNKKYTNRNDDAESNANNHPEDKDDGIDEYEQGKEYEMFWKMGDNDEDNQHDEANGKYYVDNCRDIDNFSGEEDQYIYSKMTKKDDNDDLERNEYDHKAEYDRDADYEDGDFDKNDNVGNDEEEETVNEETDVDINDKTKKEKNVKYSRIAKRKQYDQHTDEISDDHEDNDDGFGDYEEEEEEGVHNIYSDVTESNEDIEVDDVGEERKYIQVNIYDEHVDHEDTDANEYSKVNDNEEVESEVHAEKDDGNADYEEENYHSNPKITEINYDDEDDDEGENINDYENFENDEDGDNKKILRYNRGGE